MANISGLLDIIKNATYGRDMRSALHDSIEKVNNDLEGAVTEVTISNGALYTETVDGAVKMEKIPFGALAADTVSASDGGSVQSAIDSINTELNGDGVSVDVTPLSSCCYDTDNDYYEFTFDTDNEVLILNDLTADKYDIGSSDHYLNGENVSNDADGNVQWLRCGSGDPVWLFSQVIKSGCAYRLRLDTMPQSGAEWNDGTLTVLEELHINNGIKNRLSALENTVGTANAVLEALLTEGV